jgi:parallel beta-helix repeat protein
MTTGHIVPFQTVARARFASVFAATLTLGLFAVAASNASAATFYVATNGSDSNSCTQAQSTSTPKRNIMGATGGLACLSAGAGDKLSIRGGTYTEALNNNAQAWPSGTSWTNAATIAAFPAESVTLTGPIGLAGPAAYIILDRMIVDGGRCTYCHELVWTGNGAHHIRFSNMEVRNNPYGQNLVTINNQGSFIEFLGGSVHDAHGTAAVDTTTNGFYGFYIMGDDNLIDGVTVYNTVAYGIHVYNEGNNPDRNTIRNCVVHHISQVRSGSITMGILLGVGDRNTAYNNVVHNIGTGDGVGIMSSNGATNSRIYNNTVTRSYFGVAISNTTGPIVRNNILSANNGGNYYDYGGTSGASVSGNLCSSSGAGCALVGDPMFVDTASNNFGLLAQSPAIDRGVTLSDIPPYDANGTARPQGTGWDIGAYEYIGASTFAPAAPTAVRILR